MIIVRSIFTYRPTLVAWLGNLALPLYFSHSVVQNMNQLILTVTYKWWMQCQPVIQIGTLCCENPISVSRKFSLKLHAFSDCHPQGKGYGACQSTFLQERVSSVWSTTLSYCCLNRRRTSHWWKPAREGVKMDKWQSLEEKTNPELHWLVSRYQMHKCSRHCREQKYEARYITNASLFFAVKLLTVWNNAG